MRWLSVAFPGLAAQRDALRNLYRTLLMTGRPVQVRTFHSWFAALLRSAPLSVLEGLGLPAHYELMEDDKEAVALVWRRFHVAVAADPQARRDFENSVAREASRRGMQGVVCGHIHRAAMHDIHGVLYCNTGDWVESCTALLERPDGALELLAVGSAALPAGTVFVEAAGRAG